MGKYPFLGVRFKSYLPYLFDQHPLSTGFPVDTFSLDHEQYVLLFFTTFKSDIAIQHNKLDLPLSTHSHFSSTKYYAADAHDNAASTTRKIR